MNKRLIPVLILCGLLSACSGSSSSSGALSPECERNYDLATVYIDKLEATGRFPSDKIECFRHNYAAMKAATVKSASREADYLARVNNSCRASVESHQMLIKKADEIPHLSQEEFDADWGEMECRRI
jgi:hypothetical protein